MKYLKSYKIFESSSDLTEDNILIQKKEYDRGNDLWRYTILFTYIEDKKILGSVSIYYYENSPVPVIEDLYIDPSERTRKVGKFLIDYIIGYSYENINQDEIWLYVYGKSWVSEWYERLGFEFDHTDESDKNKLWYLKQF